MHTQTHMLTTLHIYTHWHTLQTHTHTHEHTTPYYNTHTLAPQILYLQLVIVAHLVMSHSFKEACISVEIEYYVCNGRTNKTACMGRGCAIPITRIEHDVTIDLIAHCQSFGSIVFVLAHTHTMHTHTLEHAHAHTLHTYNTHSYRFQLIPYSPYIYTRWAEVMIKIQQVWCIITIRDHMILVILYINTITTMNIWEMKIKIFVEICKWILILF